MTLAELECMEGPDECVGEVAYRWPGYGDRCWPRCEHHGTARLQREDTARNRYPDGPCVPADFDPFYAGESWEET
jgi:hypothetical protein